MPIELADGTVDVTAVADSVTAMANSVRIVNNSLTETENINYDIDYFGPYGRITISPLYNEPYNGGLRIGNNYWNYNYYATNSITSLTLNPSYLSTTTSGTVNGSDGSITIGSIAWTKLNSFALPILSAAEKLRQIIRDRYAPKYISSQKNMPLALSADVREARARETLKRLIGEEKFERFKRKGFIGVRGKSGRMYQIFPGHKMTKVFENDKQVGALCIILTDNFAPTDWMIMRYLLILHDEKRFWDLSNKHGFDTNSNAHYNAIQASVHPSQNPKNLIEIFADLKKQRKVA